MLRPEQRRHIDVRILEHHIDDVAEPMIDRGGIADEPDALAAEASGVEQTCGAERDWHGGIIAHQDSALRASWARSPVRLARADSLRS